MPLRRIRIARHYLFYNKYSGKLLGGNIAITVHEYDKRFLLIGFHYKSFNHSMFENTEFNGKLMRAAVLLIAIHKRFKQYIFLPEKSNCRSDGIIFFCHGKWLMVNG